MAILKADKNGKAPANAKVGDTIRTAGGDYKITGGTSGNWKSEKVNTSSTGGTTTTGGNKSNNANNTSITPVTTSPIKTNTSYNGNFLTIDNNTDYQSKINNAVAAGDYVTAAQAEAERNAKLIYLNRANEVTNNYTKVYGNGTNNQGGTIYTNSLNNISDSPSNWTTMNVNGATYKKDSSGKIYQQTGANQSGKTYSLVGDGFNANTNEFTFSNSSDAANKAYDEYIASGGNAKVSKDYALKNLIDMEYVNSLLGGTVGKYTNDVASAAKEKNAIASALKENSFESDYEEDDVDENTASTTIEVDDTASSEYQAAQARLDYIKKLLSQSRVHIF